MDVRADSPSEPPRWEPFTVEQVAERLAAAAFPWWIAGGWALDLFLTRQTRAHGDIDVAIFRGDERALARHLPSLELVIAERAGLAPWSGDAPLPASAHQLWARERGRDVWQLEVLLEERSEDRWVYRRDASIRLRAADIGRRTAEGVPYLRPEIQLLYKSKEARAVDESDLIALLPRLDPAQRGFLAAALWKVAPGHRWLERLK